MDRILDTVTTWAPDILTMQEVRARHFGAITEQLENIGLAFHYMSESASDTENGILIASRYPIEAGDFVEDRDGLCHILEAEIAGLTVLPVHFPQKAAQVPLFEALAKDTPSLLGLDAVVIGDLNCGIPFEDSMTKTFSNAKHFQALKDAGWVDAYRKRNGAEARDYSWVSPRTDRGFRYDHALVSPTVATRVRDVRYDHGVRTAGLSDHSALIVDIDD